MIIEKWPFGKDEKGNKLIKLYTENSETYKQLRKFSFAVSGAKYYSKSQKLIGWDVIIPESKAKFVEQLEQQKPVKKRSAITSTYRPSNLQICFTSEDYSKPIQNLG